MKSEKIKSFLSSKKNITIIYVIVIIGVLSLCMPSFFEGGEEPGGEITLERGEGEEEKIEKILSQISGVGKCSVLITYKSTGEYITAKDTSKREGESGVDTDEKNVLIGSGSGEKPFIVKEEMPKVQGVVVVCEGGGSTKVKSDVTEAVAALCAVSANRIKVFER